MKKLFILLVLVPALCLGADEKRTINDGLQISTTNDVAITGQGGTQYVPVQLVNGNTNPVSLDPTTRDQVVATRSERNTNAGKNWTYKDFIDDVANGDAVVFAFVCTNGCSDKPHIQYEFASQTEFSMHAYTNATITNYGTRVTSYANNRLGSTNQANLEIWSTPLLSSYGGKFWGAKTGSGRSVGGATESSEKWVIDCNAVTNVYFVATNNSGSAAGWFAWQIKWNEYTDLTD